MPFNTYTFFAFFAVLLIVHYSLRNWKAQKINLLTASYLFYSAWNPVFVLLLILSTVCDWYIAKKIFNSNHQKKRKSYLVFSLLLNLGLLSYFKYGGFFLENSIYVLSLMGVVFKPVDIDIILPVGISFYTFQTLSYSLDVYRRKIKPGKSLLDYALYVSFFPQLVAGPIVRANDFIPQCETPRKPSQDQFGWGLSLLTIGLFMKMIIADELLAPVVDKVYQAPELYGSIETWAAIFAFSGQIFCDFSGYSTCAIGAALCLGFVLPDNFKAPYAAVGFKDFWSRWHISLSTWLRDYLYISLGGNRISVRRTSINLMITMLIGGLWHGASWLFVIWGGLHGCYLIIENKIRTLHVNEVSIITRFFIIILTYIVVSLTWVFFRSQNMHDAMTIFSNIYNATPAKQSWQDGLTVSEINISLLIALLLLFWHIYIRESSIESFYSKIHPIFRSVLLLSQIAIIFLFSSGDDRAFIYFQF
jgi:alginate O-acetyltransferase complex protein AlgI